MTMMELKKVEEAEWVKAFFAAEDNGDKAWKAYWRNVKKAVKEFERETGLKVDVDALTDGAF